MDRSPEAVRRRYKYAGPDTGDDRVWSETGCTCVYALVLIRAEPSITLTLAGIEYIIVDAHEDIQAFLAHGQELVVRLNGDVSDIELNNIRSYLHLLDLRIATIQGARTVQHAHNVLRKRAA